MKKLLIALIAIVSITLSATAQTASPSVRHHDRKEIRKHDKHRHRHHRKFKKHHRRHHRTAQVSFSTSKAA